MKTLIFEFLTNHAEGIISAVSALLLAYVKRYKDLKKINQDIEDIKRYK